MKKFYIKEIEYVCQPSDLSIKMIHDHSRGKVQVNFYNLTSRCFFISQQMRITDKKEDFDVTLEFVLTTLFDMYDRKGFQNDILYGDIQGLNFYDNLQTVRNKLGTVIWNKN